MAHYYKIQMYNPTKEKPGGTCIHTMQRKKDTEMTPAERSKYHAQRSAQGLKNDDFHINKTKKVFLTFELINTNTKFHATNPFVINSISGTQVPAGTNVPGVKIQRISDGKVKVTFDKAAAGDYKYTLNYDGFSHDPVIRNGDDP